MTKQILHENIQDSPFEGYMWHFLQRYRMCNLIGWVRLP